MKLFKKTSDELIVGGHSVDVYSIIRDGQVLHTTRTAKSLPKDHIEPRIMEIMYGTRHGRPFFAYYLCPPYYSAIRGPAGAAAFGGHQRTDQFQMAVSESIARFLIITLEYNLQIKIRSEIINFSHNRARTNIFAYVASQRDWFPVQHHAGDGEQPARKIDRINSGMTPIAELLAVDKLSPSSLQK